MATISKITHKVLHGGGFFTFIRSSVAAQIASWSDMAVRFILFSFVFVAMEPFYRSNLSVAIGAVVGGVINCCINYKFTFHASGQSVKAVSVKYFMVWVGSLLLNMYGTTFASMTLGSWTWLTSTFNLSPDTIFAVATLLVSLIVSLAWNYLLQRNFVYRPSAFDRYAIAMVNLLDVKHQIKKSHKRIKA